MLFQGDGINIFFGVNKVASFFSTIDSFVIRFYSFRSILSVLVFLGDPFLPMYRSHMEIFDRKPFVAFLVEARITPLFHSRGRLFIRVVGANWTRRKILGIVLAKPTTLKWARTNTRGREPIFCNINGQISYFPARGFDWTFLILVTRFPLHIGSFSKDRRFELVFVLVDLIDGVVDVLENSWCAVLVKIFDNLN